MMRENSEDKKIKVTCKGADLLPFDSLEEFQGDLKKISKSNLEKLKKRIIRDGINVPLFIWRVNDWCRVLDGHQRVKALQSLREDGYILPMIPVAYIEAENEKDARQKLLGISSQFGEFEIEELDEWVRELDDELAELVRLTGDEIDIFKDVDLSSGEDGELIEVKGDPVCKLGDVWLLGKHRLMCGDSTSEADVLKLMNGEKADMVFTDPPWNVNYGDVGEVNPQGDKPRKILNDFMGTEDFKKFMFKAFEQMNKASKNGAMTYVVMSPQEWGNMMLTLFQNKYHWSSTIIWNKDRMVLSRKDYHTKYEPIWYGWKEGERRLCSLSDRKQSDVWDIKRPGRSELHPTTKPIELVERAVKNSSNQVNNVLDLFGGSGSTLIACENLNRRCFMMELDEHYCDVIIHRWETLTGKKAILEGVEI